MVQAKVMAKCEIWHNQVGIKTLGYEFVKQLLNFVENVAADQILHVLLIYLSFKIGKIISCCRCATINSIKLFHPIYEIKDARAGRPCAPVLRKLDLRL